MSDGGSITRWFDSLQAGDREAAQALWRRFASRLIGLARARLRAPSPGLLEARADAVNALERVKRQRLGPVGCHGGGSGHFLLPARSDEIQFALDRAANAGEPGRDLVVGIAFHLQQCNGTEVIGLE